MNTEKRKVFQTGSGMTSRAQPNFGNLQLHLAQQTGPLLGMATHIVRITLSRGGEIKSLLKAICFRIQQMRQKERKTGEKGRKERLKEEEGKTGEMKNDKPRKKMRSKKWREGAVEEATSRADPVLATALATTQRPRGSAPTCGAHALAEVAGAIILCANAEKGS